MYSYEDRQLKHNTLYLPIFLPWLIIKKEKGILEGETSKYCFDFNLLLGLRTEL